MASRLEDVFFLPPFVVYFVCAAAFLAFVGAFVLRLVEAHDGDSDFLKEVLPDGTVRWAWEFPEKETKEERRRRWARAMRRRLWHGLQGGSLLSKDNVRKAMSAQEFIAALSASLSAGSNPKSLLASKQPPFLLITDAFGNPVELPYPTTPSPPSSKGSLGAPLQLSRADAEMIRQKLFSVAISAGPPKSLNPIVEERHITPKDADVEAASIPPVPSPLWKFVLPWFTSSKPHSKASAVGPDPSTWQDDHELVMTVGDVAATRTVLWEALRELQSAVASPRSE